MVFLNREGPLHLCLPLLNQHGHTAVFHFFSGYFLIHIFWKFLKYHIRTSPPNELRYDHYATHSQVWFVCRPISPWKHFHLWKNSEDQGGDWRNTVRCASAELCDASRSPLLVKAMTPFHTTNARVWLFLFLCYKSRVNASIYFTRMAR